MQYSHTSDSKLSLLGRAFGALLLALISPTTFSDENTTLSYDPLLFSDFHTYNPLKKGNNVNHYKGGSNLTALTNEDLNLLADNSRHQQMSASQRALNQQWLHQNSEQSDVSLGSRALQKIIQQGVKTYWDSIRLTKFKGNKIIPDSNGKGNFSSEMEYKLRLKDDEVKLALEYSF